MSRAGFEVVCKKDRSYMIDRATGAQYRIHERGGVYVMPAWVQSSFLGGGPATMSP